MALAASGWAEDAQRSPVERDSLAKLSGLTQLSVDGADEAAVYVDTEGNATSLVGDKYFTTTRKADAFQVKVRKCAGDDNPPVWPRYYDGPNMFAKGTFAEISFDGYMNDAYSKECDAMDPQTKAIISNTRAATTP